MPEVNFSYHAKCVRALRRFVTVCCCCALLVLAAAADVSYAQAGRRVAKPKNDPPVPKAAETPAPPKEERPEAEKMPLLVGSYAPPMTTRLTTDAGKLMQGAVVQRLRDSKALQIASGGDMTRGEATRRAKDGESKTFIVWLELHTGSGYFDSSRSGRTDTEDLYIQYLVLEPGTAKVKAQGNVYLRPTSSSRIGRIGIGRSLPRCYPQGLYSVELALVEAGIETAERIIRSFSLPNPQFCS